MTVEEFKALKGWKKFIASPQIQLTGAAFFVWAGWGTLSRYFAGREDVAGLDGLLLWLSFRPMLGVGFLWFASGLLLKALRINTLEQSLAASPERPEQPIAPCRYRPSDGGRILPL